MAEERAMERRNQSTAGKPSSKGANFFDEGQNDDYSSYFAKKNQSRNPFHDDAEDEAETPSPGRNGKSTRSSTLPPYGESGEEKLLSPQELYQQEVLKIQDRTLQSTHRSIGLLHESEAVGTAAAQELRSQREQLENTNKTLDEINTTLDQSQRHINNIKSIFGGIKNWWTSKTAESSATTPTASSDKLKAFVDPDAPRPAHKPAASSSVVPSIKGFRDDSNYVSPPAIVSPTPSKDFDRALDANLDHMSLGLSRLKGLAEGLGEEVTQQNRLLDDMNAKTERVDVKMGVQQKSLDKLLGKKK